LRLIKDEPNTWAQKHLDDSHFKIVSIKSKGRIPRIYTYEMNIIGLPPIFNSAMDIMLRLVRVHVVVGQRAS